LSFFADAGATTPKDVITLPLRYQQHEYHNPIEVPGVPTLISATSSGGTLDLGIFPADLTEGPNEWLWTYNLLPGAAYHIL